VKFGFDAVERARRAFVCGKKKRAKETYVAARNRTKTATRSRLVLQKRVGNQETTFGRLAFSVVRTKAVQKSSRNTMR
jgi:hypothetical protein